MRTLVSHNIDGTMIWFKVLDKARAEIHVFNGNSNTSLNTRTILNMSHNDMKKLIADIAKLEFEK